MSHHCKTCGKAFHKASARNQHERDVHVERPKQRRAEARRAAYEAERRRPAMPAYTTASHDYPRDDHLQFVSDAVDAAIMLFSVLGGTSGNIVNAAGPAARAMLALEPPTLDLVAEPGEKKP